MNQTIKIVRVYGDHDFSDHTDFFNYIKLSCCTDSSESSSAFQKIMCQILINTQTIYNIAIHELLCLISYFTSTIISCARINFSLILI